MSESLTFICTRESGRKGGGEREREGKYTVNVQCSLQYILLFYLMLVMSYCA